ncbi:Na+/H+ antiporter subunit E [Azoarcus sp. L1K30]|nr:Na+/H+ antiporter subunit E [Azoarcus sp. L1K30]
MHDAEGLQADPPRRWFPHPVLSALLVIVWLMLQNGFSLAHLVLGIFLGWGIPCLTASFWPSRPHVRSYRKALSYALLVIGDIIVANVVVARLILFSRPADLHTCWVSVPLDLHTPEAITLFAGTITMTPGTVSADLSADGRSLLVHCLNAPDPAQAVTDMKTRYEARIKEIFE